MHAHAPDEPERLSDLERRLAAWRPAPAGPDRDRLLYEAGRTAARADRRGTAGRLAIAALGLVVFVQGGLLARERVRRHDLELDLAQARSVPAPAAPVLAGMDQPPAAEPLTPPVPSSYLALSRRLISTTEPAPTGGDVMPPEAAPPGEIAPLRAFDLGRSIDL